MIRPLCMYVGIVALLVGSGCGQPREPKPPALPPAPQQPQRADGPPCAGASEAEARAMHHPSVVRGTVMRPRAASPGDVLEDQPAADAPVSLVALGARGEPGAALVTTRTDGKGRWCARLPGDRVFEGMRLMAVSEVDGVRLRQPMPYASEGRVDLAGEALVRALTARGVALDAVAAPTYQNWRTISGTTLSLWRVEGGAALRGEALITRAVAALGEEPRLVSRLK